MNHDLQLRLNLNVNLSRLYNKFNKSLDNIMYTRKIIPDQPNEIESGNREYKKTLNFECYSQLRLKNTLEKKTTQMIFRLNEGCGKAIYIIGIDDDGQSHGIGFLDLLKSLYYFKTIVKQANAHYSKIRIYSGNTGYLATIRVNKPFVNLHLLLTI